MYNNYSTCYKPFTSMHRSYCMMYPCFCPMMKMYWRNTSSMVQQDKYPKFFDKKTCSEDNSSFELPYNVKMRKVSIEEIED